MSNDVYFEYYYVYANGDYYWGYGYADSADGLTAGYYDPAYGVDESGAGGYYYVSTVTDLGADYGYDGYVVVTGYYDSSAGLAGYAYGYGYGGFGSERGYAYDASLAHYDFFGYSYYEADLSASGANDVLYVFYYVYGNGDWYYGYGWADARSGLSVGDYFGSAYGGDETGSGGYYYIAEVYEAGADLNYQGAVAVTYYYDSETASTTAVAGYGFYGVGSETGYLVSSDGGSDLFGYGYYEADLLSASVTAYSFYFVYGNGDWYGGTVYDDGSSGYYVGWSSTVTDENGNLGAYYIYGSTGAPAGAGAGEVWLDDYYDAESATYWDSYYASLGYAGGVSGLGSEADYVGDGTTYDLFGYGWYEADPAGELTAYYFFFQYGSGDYYYGVVYDDGSAGYYEGWWESGVDETGNSGYYYIYDSAAAAGTAGEVWVDDYYDSEGGNHYTPYYTALGYATGTDGLWSEYDYVGGAAGYDLFGLGYYEADQVVAAVTAYYFYFSYGDGDWYYGVVYDDGSYGYAVGDVYGSYDENGYWGYYYIYESAAATGAVGEVWVDYYYDAESGASYTPYYVSWGYASGEDGLGSEWDYVGYTASYDLFGYGYYEADATSGTVAAYYFYFVYGSGDWYYGVVYDDGYYGYYEGWYTYSTDENGETGFYYIYDSATAVDASAGVVYVDYYYDSESGSSSQPYYAGWGYASGYNGLGSERDYIQSEAGYDLFGYGWYEADVVDPGLTVYYFYVQHGGGDYYYGSVYDDGAYGYYVGWYSESTDENGDWVYYYIYDADAVSGGTVGEVLIYYYHNAETSLNYDPYYASLGYASGTNGLGSEYDYITDGSTYDVFAYGYWEADLPLGDRVFEFVFTANSGDVYYGYAIDDGSYGYYVGQTITGSTGSYYIQSGASTDLDYAAGYVWVTDYYDSYSGTWGNAEGDAYGYSGLGSEDGWIYADVGYGYGYMSASSLDEANFGVEYYFVFAHDNGDRYWGLIVDDGSLGIGVGDTYATDYGSYTIYWSFPYDWLEATAGTISLTAYYDASTGIYGAVDGGGNGGLGSEYGYAYTPSYGEYFGYGGAMTAELPSFGAGDVTYYFWFQYDGAGNDVYYGYVHDDGSYGYQVGDVVDTAYGYYLIYGAATATDDQIAGTVGLTDYYDADDSGWNLAVTGGGGSAGLGSELGYADANSSWSLAFGYGGAMEADYSTYPDTEYAYEFRASSGDIYYGYTWDDGGYGYYVGYTEETAYGYYVITAAYALGYNADYTGEVSIESYYDSASGLTGDAEGYGYSGLGSESGYAQNPGDLVWETVGYGGLYQADFGTTPVTGFTYEFRADSGDIYYGNVSDDGSYGYTVGYTQTTAYGYYIITDTAPETSSAGDSHVHWYYDASSGVTTTAYGYSSGGFGAETGYAVDPWSGAQSLFGQGGSVQLDFVEPTNTLYYFTFSYSNGDYYYGTVVDDGSYGYFIDQTITTAYGYYLLTDSAALPAGSGTVGEVIVDSYYDADTAVGLVDTVSATGTDGLGSEYGYGEESLTGYRDGFGLGGREEADLDGSAQLTAYYFTYTYPNSGDSFSGVVFDDGSGYQSSVYGYVMLNWTEDANYLVGSVVPGTVYLTDSYADTAAEGYYLTQSTTLGTAAGDTGIDGISDAIAVAADDWVSFDTATGANGGSSYVYQAYEFTFYDASSGDFYSGILLNSTQIYVVGSTVETADGYYWISDGYNVTSGSTLAADSVILTSYHDDDASGQTSWVTWGLIDDLPPQATSGLGSEYDYIWNYGTGSWDLFGYAGAQDADIDVFVLT